MDGAELDGPADGAGPDGALPIDGEVTGPPTPDAGFELGEDDPFETGPYADERSATRPGRTCPTSPRTPGSTTPRAARTAADAAGGAYRR